MTATTPTKIITYILFLNLPEGRWLLLCWLDKGRWDDGAWRI